jgi:CheY-like chemotaxis protein
MDPSPPPDVIRCPLHVLIVEHDGEAARCTAILLQLEGYTVETVPDGPAALEKYETYKPDLVLLDLALPGMDGYDVAEQLNRRGEPPLIVAVTEYGVLADRQRAGRAGIPFHFLKPVQPEFLLRLLKSLEGWLHRARQPVGVGPPPGALMPEQCGLPV